MTTTAVRDAPSVVVIVLNWNGREDTMNCLKSLQAIDYPNWEVLVVDNGSEDSSVHAIRDGYPDVTILETGKNLGFAGGNNRGIELALSSGTEFILLLNNDTTVASNLLHALVRAAEEHRDAGVFGAKIYLLSDSERLWYAGTRWNSTIFDFEHIGVGVLDNGTDFEEIRDTEYACGCAMFFRASTAREVGMLDERFFLLYEDTDWCFRARKAGFRCLFVPDAKVWHRVSASLGGRRSIIYEYFKCRNRLLWAERHAGLKRQLGVWENILDTISALGEVCRTLREFRRGHAVAKRTYWNIRTWLQEWRDEVRTPNVQLVRKVQRRALCDYLIRRFGDCPASVRATADKGHGRRGRVGDSPTRSRASGDRRKSRTD